MGPALLCASTSWHRRRSEHSKSPGQSAAEVLPISLQEQGRTHGFDPLCSFSAPCIESTQQQRAFWQDSFTSTPWQSTGASREFQSTG